MSEAIQGVLIKPDHHAERIIIADTERYGLVGITSVLGDGVERVQMTHYNSKALAGAFYTNDALIFDDTPWNEVASRAARVIAHEDFNLYGPVLFVGNPDPYGFDTSLPQLAIESLEKFSAHVLWEHETNDNV